MAEACAKKEVEEKYAMKPYYMDEDRGIAIYHGDAAQVMPFLGRFDLLLTDPPYGIGEARSGNVSRSNLAVATDYGDSAWDDRPVEKWLLEEAVSLARWSIVFGGNYYELPPSRGWLVWDKDNGESDFADCELAWTNLDRAVRRLKWRWHGMIQELAGSKKEPRWHPTQKPLEVMKWAISMAPEECSTILDPFMGSGTTLVAAREMGKRAVGIEREEKYCKAAVDRLAQGLLFTQAR